MDIEKKLLALRLGTEYKWKVKLNTIYHGVVEAVFRPLTQKETLAVGESVQKALMRMTPEQRLGVSEAQLVAKETLKRAATDRPDDEMGDLSDKLLDDLTPDEFSALYKSYVKIVEEVNPLLEAVELAKVQEIIEALKKTPQDQLLSQIIGLSIMEMASVCRALTLRD